MASSDTAYTAEYGDYYPKELDKLLKASQKAYENRSSRPDYPEKTVPEGWPAQLPPSPMVWDSETFPKDRSHMIDLSPEEVAEVEKALKFVEDLGLSHSAITKSTFSLPKLGPRLDAACKSVHNGLGICFVNGIPSHKFTADQNVYILLGISSYFGESRGRQRDDGAKLIHIFHSLTRGFDENLSPIYNNHAQVFHNDMVTDILCMYCIRTASHGGSNSYASIQRIYNHLAEHNPEMIHTLAAPDWPFDTYGYNPPYQTRPLLFYSRPGEQDEEDEQSDEENTIDEDDDGSSTPRAATFDPGLPETDSEENITPKIGRILASFSPRQLSGSKVHPRPSDIPALTERQTLALEEIERLANKYCLTETLSSGSMLFLNNLAMIHNRTSYTEEAGKPVEEHRHLIRMFLRNDELAWKTPKGLWLDWSRVFGEFEGENEERWVADKVKDYKDQQRGLTTVKAGGEDSSGLEVPGLYKLD
ncbi:hypothetical protein H072_9295 [Dactylellina haptotyla CBS 200.50]|uniref:TauD/TfdA-like domain-containing protein n=1 Tax=Dactylellina haptotyla (strain CBS 200.50) TaxID=1284197 RepID=S8A251_DACHA|nr:hypothetical protein H072_9295 [Dactylellina haptotyla CBS 200.50]